MVKSVCLCLSQLYLTQLNCTCLYCSLCLWSYKGAHGRNLYKCAYSIFDKSSFIFQYYKSLQYCITLQLKLFSATVSPAYSGPACQCTTMDVFARRAGGWWLFDQQLQQTEGQTHPDGSRGCTPLGACMHNRNRDGCSVITCHLRASCYHGRLNFTEILADAVWGL